VTVSGPRGYQGDPGISDEELMRYQDGEMSPQEARALERRLAASPEAQAAAQVMKEALAQVGDVVRARYEAAAEDAQPRLDVLWNRLERQLTGRPEARPSPGWVARLRDWLDDHRSHVLTGAVCAAVGAFVAVVMAGHPSKVAPKVVERVVEKDNYVYVPETPGMPFSTEVAQADTPAPAEIESLEVTGGSGTIVRVPDEEGDSSTTIIWVTPNEEPGSEGPI
jgi:anti-sigma factor RsiW